MDFFKGVNRFNREVLGIVPPIVAGPVPEDRLKWLELALREELDEFLTAKTAEDQADALLDLMYFAAGELYKMGVDGQKAFDAVHAANMQKVRGELSKRPGSKGYDATKPPGWQAPDISQAMKPARPRIMIAGYNRPSLHTVATMLSVYGLRYTKMADALFIDDFVYPYAMRRNLVSPHTSSIEMLLNRHKYKDLMRNAYAHFWESDKLFLVKALKKTQEVYCGISNAAEAIEAFRRQEYDHLLWVDDSRKTYLEPGPDFTVTCDMASYVIDNNEDMAHLASEVYEFSVKCGLACDFHV